MQTIRRVGVGSAFKVGFAFNALIMIVVGFFLVFLPSLLGGMFIMSEVSELGGMGFIGGLIAYALLVLFGGLGGGIAFALYAFLYNLAAGWMGGFEVEIS